MLLDFDAGWRKVRLGGRTFRVRRPTVAAVYAAVRLFGAELAAIAGAPGAEKYPVLTVARGLVEVGAARASQLVMMVADGDGSPDDGWPVAELLAASLDGVDLMRVARSFSLGGSVDGVDGAVPEGMTDEDQDDSICHLALHFHATPIEVLDWPYEAMISASESVARYNEAVRLAAATGGDGSWSSRDVGVGRGFSPNAIRV